MMDLQLAKTDGATISNLQIAQHVSKMGRITCTHLVLHADQYQLGLIAIDHERKSSFQLVEDSQHARRVCTHTYAIQNGVSWP